MAGRKISDDLFRLIKSLNTEEKGYVVKFAKRHSEKGSDFLTLFYDIDKQAEYDEKALKKAHKNIAGKKVYLFNLMMQALLQYSANDVSAEMLKNLIYVKLLQQRGLADKANELNKKGLELAARTESFWLQEQFLTNALMLERFGSLPGEAVNKHVKYQQQIADLWEKHQNKVYYFFAQRKLAAFELQTNYSKNTDLTIDSLFDLEQLKKKLPYYHPSIQRQKLLALAQHARLKGDALTFYEYTRQIYEGEEKLWRQKHPLTNEDIYLSSLRNMLYAAKSLKKFDFVLKKADEMSRLKLNSGFWNEQNQITCMHLKCCCFFETGRHAEGEKLLAQWFGAKSGDKSNLNDNFLLEFHAFRVLFRLSLQPLAKAFVAIADFNKIAEEKGATFSIECCGLASLLLQIEIDNYTNFKSKVNKWLKKASSQNYPAGFLSIIKSLATINATNKTTTLRQALKQVEALPEEFYLFEMLPARLWFKAMLTHRPINTLLAESNKSGA